MKCTASSLHTIAIFISTFVVSVDSLRTLSNSVGSSKLVNSSLVSVADVLAVVKGMDNHEKVNLQLLYDVEYEGMVGSISKQFSASVAGMMGFQGNVTNSLLSTMLNAASDSTFLLVMRSPVDVLDMFALIRLKRQKSHLVHWLIFLEVKDTVNTFVRNLEGLVHEGTKVTIFNKEPNGYFLIFAAGLEREGGIRFRPRGVWKNTNAEDNNMPLRNLMSSSEQHRYMNMQGRKLTVATLNAWPFFKIGQQFSDGSYEAESGIEASVVKTLSSTLNFTFRVLLSATGAPGYPQPDGTVTGIIGMAARREAHMALCLIAVNEKRSTVVDFTYPHYRAILSISSNAPGLKNRALAVLSSFTLEVWICIMTSVVSMGFVAYIFSMTSLLYQKGTREKTESLPVYLFNIFRNIVVQGNMIRIRQWPQRLLFYSWYLFCLIVSALYSGMLTAVLTIPAYETPIDYLTDLPRAVEKGFTLSVMADSTNEYLFKDATYGIYKQIWPLFDNKDRSQSFVSSPGIGMKRILERKYVYMGPYLISRVIAMQMGDRKFHFGRQKFFPQDVGIALPQGAPYKNIFDQKLLRIVEGGLILKWQENEIRKISQTASGQEGDESRISALTLTHLQAAMYTAAIGYLVASVFLIFEKVSRLTTKTKDF